MPEFAFVVKGPPGATVNTKEKKPRRYHRWVEAVKAVAQAEWPVEQPLLLSNEIIVSVSNYFLTPPDRPAPPDVDNILKPILDALIGVVYVDDRQVFRVISERYSAEAVENAAGLVTSYLPIFRELLYVRVTWIEE